MHLLRPVQLARWISLKVDQISFFSECLWEVLTQSCDVVVNKSDGCSDRTVGLVDLVQTSEGFWWMRSISCGGSLKTSCWCSFLDREAPRSYQAANRTLCSRTPVEFSEAEWRPEPSVLRVLCRASGHLVFRTWISSLPVRQWIKLSF